MQEDGTTRGCCSGSFALHLGQPGYSLPYILEARSQGGKTVDACKYTFVPVTIHSISKRLRYLRNKNTVSKTTKYKLRK